MPTLRTFQVGSARKRGEGLRLGTVRYLPKFVKTKDLVRLNYFDLWFPLLAPSRELLRSTWSKELTDARWAKFAERYARELLRNTDSHQALKLIAQVAERTPISIGCYCEDEKRCHRSILQKLIKQVAR